MVPTGECGLRAVRETYRLDAAVFAASIVPEIPSLVSSHNQQYSQCAALMTNGKSSVYQGNAPVVSLKGLHLFPVFNFVQVH
jgi:hypothetical protein